MTPEHDQRGSRRVFVTRSHSLCVWCSVSNSGAYLFSGRGIKERKELFDKGAFFFMKLPTILTRLWRVTVNNNEKNKKWRMSMCHARIFCERERDRKKVSSSFYTIFILRDYVLKVLRRLNRCVLVLHVTRPEPSFGAGERRYVNEPILWLLISCIHQTLRLSKLPFTSCKLSLISFQRCMAK